MVTKYVNQISYSGQRDGCSLEQSVHDQHSCEVNHDVCLEMINADEVCEVSDCPQGEGGEVDTDDKVCKSSFSNNLKICSSS